MAGKNQQKSEAVQHTGHRERLKKRALEEGLNSFSDIQVLELLLFYALPYRDTNGLAHKLLQHFGSFCDVLDADYHDLLRVDGVGPNTAALLALLPEFFRRYYIDQQGPKVILDDTEAIGRYACGLFIGSIYEAFYLICLDVQNQVNKAALISSGTLLYTAVPYRLLVEVALRYHADKVVFVHNHPGGLLYPSSDDLNLTNGAAEALAAVSVKVVDHLIVHEDHYFSFKAAGLLRGK